MKWSSIARGELQRFVPVRAARAGEEVRGRPLVVPGFRPLAEMQTCHILYIGRNAGLTEPVTMFLENLPIKRKVMAVVLLTSLSVLVLTAAALMLYDYASFRRTLVRNLSITGSIIADNSTTALDFKVPKDAQEILSALHGDPHIVAAALYDDHDQAFVRYPASRAINSFPLKPGPAGWRFGARSLVLFTPVVQGGKRLGTLYLESDLGALSNRRRIYGTIVLAVLCGSMAVALLISSALQRRITHPILALAGAARIVSERRDYSVRAPPAGGDELGQLTEAFNAMLEHIQEAQQTRSHLAAIVESSDDAIVGKDLEGKVVSWNVGAERMFGYPAQEMIGQPITRIVPPERRDEEAQIRENARRGEVHRYETVRQRKDGGRLDISLTISPIRDGSGRIVGLSSISRDVTERKQAERALQESQARLSGVIGSAMDAIISVDANQRVTIFNAAAEKMFACPAAEALGRPLDRFIPQRFREAHRLHLEKFGRAGTTSRTMGSLQPLAGLRASGEEFPIEASISQIGAGAEKVFTVILRDITERKEAEERIRQMNAELEQRVKQRTAELTTANQELEAFTYSVAHDLRAPLRHIDAFSRLLSEDFAPQLPAEAQRYLQNLRHGARQMSQLVDDLLNLAHVSRQPLKYQPVPLDELVGTLVNEIKAEAGARQLEWRLHPLPKVQCDPGLMRQVFANLLSNASKYTRPRSPAVIEVGCQPKNGQTAIYVRDNGVGFDMKYVDKLFGVFQRLHRSEEFEGTGVGLAIVERVVRRHGGAVWAEGTVGKGATFYFTLPGLDK